MLASVELAQNRYEYDASVETYACSQSTLRRLGHVALHVESSSYEALAAKELAFDDFKTALAEMLKTDPELRQFFDIDNQRIHQVVDGQVVSVYGDSMVWLLKNGVESSEQAAETNPELEAQVERDKADVRLAGRVDALEVGQTIWGMSMDPKEQLRLYPKTYKGKLGYKDGLAYVQTYSRVDEHTLVAGSYSVDMSKDKELRELLQKRGMPIPETADLNNWLDHAQQITATAEEAKELALGLRTEHYEQEGSTTKRKSINQFVEDNIDKVRQLFEAYYIPLAKAVYTGENSQTIKSFVDSLLSKNIAELKPDIRRKLIKISNSNKFDNESGRVMDSVLRYAVTEELRKDLIPAHKESDSNLEVRAGVYYDRPLSVAQMHNLLASNVQSGVQAGRAYGGCPGNIELSEKLADEMLSDVNKSSRQEAFGGKGDEDCEFISEECPICGAKDVKTKSETIVKDGKKKRQVSGDCGCSKIYDKAA